MSTVPARAASYMRRNPLTDVNNPHKAYTPPASPPLKHEEKPKPPSSPPLPRQNTKITPPSPPKVIVDRSRDVEFLRVGLLGEGGFARVYEIQDKRGSKSACKVVTKSSLKTKKAKTKLYAEIKIHKSLTHPNIVHFHECFEDDDNVYMTLELCPNGSLMDMLRRRRRFTEPEARLLMVQLIGACHYMHTHQVIHRDLKLGNLFLDANMNVKVGDFGLAALIENPGERKKTICGTPNYIAPEVLFDTANGHSFEVDTWSIGVILYTLIIGRPPFQTKDVKAIYKRIRANQYEFPQDREISADASELIQQILTPDPQLRPTLHEIVDHPFFTEGIVPSYLPTTAHDSAPDYRHISHNTSKLNLARLRTQVLLDDEVTSIAVPGVMVNSTNTTLNATTKIKASATSTLAQQEKEFLKAVQPGSPISALLSSARQPLLMSTNSTRDSPLIRKLQAARLDGSASGANGTKGGGKSLSRGGPKEPRLGGGLGNINEEINEEEEMVEELRKKELESQKARIVAQMVPGSVMSAGFPFDEQENVPPTLKVPKGRLRAKDSIKEDVAAAMPTTASGTALKLNGFEAAAQTLTAAFEAKSAGKLFRNPRDDKNLPDAKVFIVSWVDYCNKYGMGYALTDGSVGVHFNDSTTLVLSADKHHFDSISSRRHGSVYVRKNFTVSEYPEELKSKVYLLKHFERYIMDRLYGEYDYTYEDVDRTKGMDFVQKYLRMKHVIVFKMSHDVIQFNFYDHSKVILSSQGLVVTHIDKNYNLTRWTLSEIMAQALKGPLPDPDQGKFQQKLIDKLKYCKEVLISIRNASAAQPGSEDGQEIDGGMGMMGSTKVKGSMQS